MQMHQCEWPIALLMVQIDDGQFNVGANMPTQHCHSCASQHQVQHPSTTSQVQPAHSQSSQPTPKAARAPAAQGRRRQACSAVQQGLQPPTLPNGADNPHQECAHSVRETSHKCILTARRLHLGRSAGSEATAQNVIMHSLVDN